MPLEAVMLVLDNSSHAINGDYTPTRFGAQRDAANVLFMVKTNSNPETVVGLMTMGGRGPEVLVTPTQDEGKIVAALHNVNLAGTSDLTAGIQVAQLALKHRQNKNQRQRVIVFVGSPLSTDNPNLSESSLVKLGKKMKKNNVAVDVISFGSENDVCDNDTRLRAFIEAVNSGDNSRFVTIPAGIGLLSDQIRASGVLAEDGAGGSLGVDVEAGPASGRGTGTDSEFGVDPNLDPELAMALRMSLEEERARQNAAASIANVEVPAESSSAAQSRDSNVGEASTPYRLPTNSSADVASQPVNIAAAISPSSETHTHTVSSDPEDSVTANIGSAVATGKLAVDNAKDLTMMDEDADMQRALALSRGEGLQLIGDNDEKMNSANHDVNELDEDEAIARAIALSMKRTSVDDIDMDDADESGKIE